MSSSISITPSSLDRYFLRTGVYIGLGGGIAEIIVVWVYSALTGGDAANIGRQVGYAVGISKASAANGIMVHLILAAMLGVGLNYILQFALARHAPAGKVFTASLCTLTLIWAVNFFVVLPLISPSFVHVLPYAVTLFSKLMFGVVAAATFCSLRRRPKRKNISDEIKENASPAG